MLTALNPFDHNQPFPDVTFALKEPNGLLAVGGCLSPQRLVNAYRRGVFPWYGEGEPILWWSPDPRLVLFPEQFQISRSLRKSMRRNGFRHSFDRCFSRVVNACAQPRAYALDTWISPEIMLAYCQLHDLGMAHSFECWHGSELVGGLYGVAMGQVFFGESMFHRATDASKSAFAYAVNCLAEWGFRLIDCQVRTEHLMSLGAVEIPRQTFVDLLEIYCNRPPAPSAWARE